MTCLPRGFWYEYTVYNDHWLLNNPRQIGRRSQSQYFNLREYNENNTRSPTIDKLAPILTYYATKFVPTTKQQNFLRVLLLRDVPAFVLHSTRLIRESPIPHHLCANTPPKPPEVAGMAKESVHPVSDELVRRFSLPRGATRYSQKVE